MMIALLAAALLVVCPCIAVELDGDADIYESAVAALEELRVRELAEENGLYQGVQRAPSVCYEELGCFDTNGTFKHLKQLPEPPESVNTQFLLYTRKNPNDPQIIDYKKPETISNSNIDVKLPIKIMTHGFGGRSNLTWLWLMKNTFLEKEDINIIVIDWSLGARAPYYIAAAVNTELVGAQAAVLFYYLKDKLGFHEKNLHVVGFSLGAHVAGFIGKRMQLLGGKRPGRVTGLDPASPLFEDYGGEVHLYKDDGDFVDIIHTNADLLIYGGVGIGKPLGHVDYFPNGGKRQPGCKSTIGGALKDLFNDNLERTCNHERAVHLFVDSIMDDNSCKYTAYRCDNYVDFGLGKCLSCADSCGEMGYYTKGTGNYYLMTKATKPFCVEMARVTARFPKAIKRSYGLIVLTLVGKNGEKENVTLTKKDEKLTAGDEKTYAVPIDDVLKPLDSIQVLYVKYNGWLTKGTDTFGLASVTIEDNRGSYLFKSCGEDIILNHDEYYHLKETDQSC